MCVCVCLVRACVCVSVYVCVLLQSRQQTLRSGPKRAQVGLEWPGESLDNAAAEPWAGVRWGVYGCVCVWCVCLCVCECKACAELCVNMSNESGARPRQQQEATTLSHLMTFRG